MFFVDGVVQAVWPDGAYDTKLADFSRKFAQPKYPNDFFSHSNAYVSNII